MRKTLFSLQAIILLLIAGHAFAYKPDSVPDWVRTAAQQKLPAYTPETDAVVLLDDITYTVAPDGSAVEHHRHVIKILRPQGRKDAIVGVPFDKDTKILSMHVWSIGPDGHEYVVKDNEMTEHGLAQKISSRTTGYVLPTHPAGTPAVSSPTSTSSAADLILQRRPGSSRIISLTSARALPSHFRRTSPMAQSGPMPNRHLPSTLSTSSGAG